MNQTDTHYLQPPRSAHCESTSACLVCSCHQDFNISILIDRLSNFSDPSFDAAWMHLTPAEAEALAALLIHQLADALSGHQIAAYLHALRSGEPAELPPIPLPTAHPMAQLPANFPDAAPMPLFVYGDAVAAAHPDDDTLPGVIIGRTFAYAHHQGRWYWQYQIWHTDGLGQTWSDLAWEDALVPLEAEAL